MTAPGTFARAELALARTADPYLLLDLSRGRLEVRIGGTLLWEIPFRLEPSDTGRVELFRRRFHAGGDILARPLRRLAATDVRKLYPDSLLAVVSGALRVEPGLIQRRVPGRLLLVWSVGIRLDLRTADHRGGPADLLEDARYLLRRPFGAAEVRGWIEPSGAATLHHLLHPGIFVLVR